MFLVEEKKLSKMISKKVYISRVGRGQFGKSLHFDFFYGFPKCQYLNIQQYFTFYLYVSLIPEPFNHAKVGYEP